VRHYTDIDLKEDIKFTAPRISSSKRADGTMESKPMEDLWPFLDREEFELKCL
jgi:acetolactate synthase-1/2/3 large subunit